MMNDNLAGHRTVVVELRNTFDRVYAASDVMDGKIQNVFGASGILITLATIGPLAVLKDRIGVAFWVGLAIVMVLYVAMYLAIFVGLRPRVFELPISMDWDELVERYLDETEPVVTERLIVDYIKVIALAQGINAEKSKALNVALGFFVAIVAAILGAIAIGV